MFSESFFNTYFSHIRLFMKNAYFRFLSLVNALEQDSDLQRIDQESKRLLDVITVKHHAGSALTVTQAMALEFIASPATIHRKIDLLLEMGLIDFEFKDGNRRSKYLVPTQTADAHYAKLGKALSSATKHVA